MLGIIADDFTGATDIGCFVAKHCKTIMVNGVPKNDDVDVSDSDAIVISLKSRSIASRDAVSLSLESYRWLRAQGADRIFFKYCSTFDSTSDGNIGPVADALLREMNEQITVICPALPVNGRTVYRGYLFVYDTLLHESSMKDHPINPMRDSHLGRLLESQSQYKAGLIPLSTIRQGRESIIKSLESIQQEGKRYVIVDCLTEQDLDIIADAFYDKTRLYTGGSGLGGSIAALIAREGTATSDSKITIPKKKTVVLSGSCSSMTRAQIQYYSNLAPHKKLSIHRYQQDGQHYIAEIKAWYKAQSTSDFAPLLYSIIEEGTAPSDGANPLSQLVEKCFADIVLSLSSNDVHNYIVAGGETSGSVVMALGVGGVIIGPEIAPGVPWVQSLDAKYSLALKSGNFGDETFFEQAQKFI